MKEIFLSLLDFVSSIPVGVILLFIFLSGMYAFWRGCIETGKDRSSIFDVYLFSLISGIIAGRIGYIISNIEEFSGYIWYWSPYEKYGDVVYIFRLLPWRFLRIWDGGIVVFVMFVGFLITASILVTFAKKWRWRQMYFVIFFSDLLMLSLSFLFISSTASDLNLFLTSVILFVCAISFFIISLVVSRKKKMKWRKRKNVVGYAGVGIILSVCVYLSFKFLTKEVSLAESISIYALDIWAVLSTLLFMVDMKRKKVNIEKISSIGSISLPEINQPIRLPIHGKKK